MTHPADARLPTREELEELRRLEAEATPGPWVSHLRDDQDAPAAIADAQGLIDGRPTAIAMCPRYGLEQWRRDSAWIVATRNALPSLLAAAERALELEDRCRQLEAETLSCGARIGELNRHIEAMRDASDKLEAERDRDVAAERERCQASLEILVADGIISSGRARELHGMCAEDQRSLLRRLVHKSGKETADQLRRELEGGE